MSAGERDLDTLLRTMEPRLEAGQWVFVTLSAGPWPSSVLATFREAEGLSAVVTREEADAADLAYEGISAWISLGVHSALNAVGLTAAVSAQLASAGISANIVAARHHDHVFVPFDRADEALGALRRTMERAQAT
jgi:hypothetical protein